MPRMMCPGCQRVLRVDESKRGETVGCPKCRRRFAVPRFAEDDEPLEEPTPYQLKNEPDAPRPVPVPGMEEDEEDRTRPRIRARRRARHGSGLSAFLAESHIDKALLLVAVGVWLVLIGLSLIRPVFLAGLFGAGVVMVCTARVWAIVSAFGEDGETGCTTLFFPWYGMFGLEDRRPLFLFAVGTVYVLTGVALLTILRGAG